jgi:adenosylhomocysteine nucleosidase
LANAPKIAIIAALQREIDDLFSGQTKQTRYLPGSKFPTYMLGELSVTCAGIGYDPAARAADASIQQFRPELIVSVGFAGAVDPTLNVGSLVTPRTVIDARSGTTFSTARGDGVLVSAVRIADTAEKALLRQRYGALAVDMEAAAVAEKALHYGVPFCAVKSVSDTANATLPDFTRFVQQDGSFATASFLLYLLLHPTLWPVVRSLAANSAKAARNLTTGLNEFLADMSYARSTSGQVLNSR